MPRIIEKPHARMKEQDTIPCSHAGPSPVHGRACSHGGVKAATKEVARRILLGTYSQPTGALRVGRLAQQNLRAVQSFLTSVVHVPRVGRAHALGRGSRLHRHPRDRAVGGHLLEGPSPGLRGDLRLRGHAAHLAPAADGWRVAPPLLVRVALSGRTRNPTTLDFV